MLAVRDILLLGAEYPKTFHKFYTSLSRINDIVDKTAFSGNIGISELLGVLRYKLRSARSRIGCLL